MWALSMANELSANGSENYPSGEPEKNVIEERLAISRVKLGEAAELFHSIRHAHSLTQIIQTLTHTLPTILEACVCGYITWVHSPMMGVRWEAVAGEKAGELELSRLKVDPEVSAILKTSEVLVFDAGSKSIPFELAAVMEQAECSSIQLLPVFHEGIIRGKILIGRDASRPSWSQDEINAGNEIVELALTIYGLRNNLATAEQHNHELERVFLASLDLAATLNPEDVLHNILKNALALLPGAHDAHIFYYDGDKLSFGAAMFKDGSTGKEWASPRENGLTYTVARSGDIIVVEDMRNHPLYYGTPPSWEGAIIGLPLKMKGFVIGVMTVALLEPQSFQENLLRQLRLLAEQAGIAIQNARLHNMIQEEAHTDWLTGLPNRRAFELTVGRLVEQAKLTGEEFTLMMIDLDHFKSINDTYGHLVGDDALRIIASRLQARIRKTDFLARLGGDEFAILFPRTRIDEAYAIGIALQQETSGCDLHLPDGKFGCVSISIGLSNYPKSGLTSDELLAAADTNMYVDKERV